MPDSLDIIREARECVGTPFKHLGREKGLGLDCIGLVLYVARSAGVDMSGFHDRPYGPTGDGSALVEGLKRHLRPVWLYDESPQRDFRMYLKNADVMNLAWRRNPTHVGFAAVSPHGWNIIHSFSGSRHVTEHGLDDKWRGFVRGVYRFKDVA